MFGEVNFGGLWGQVVTRGDSESGVQKNVPGKVVVIGSAWFTVDLMLFVVVVFHAIYIMIKGKHIFEAKKLFETLKTCQPIWGYSPGILRRRDNTV